MKTPPDSWNGGAMNPAKKGKDLRKITDIGTDLKNFDNLGSRKIDAFLQAGFYCGSKNNTNHLFLNEILSFSKFGTLFE